MELQSAAYQNDEKQLVKKCRIVKKWNSRWKNVIGSVVGDAYVSPEWTRLCLHYLKWWKMTVAVTPAEYTFGTPSLAYSIYIK